MPNCKFKNIESEYDTVLVPDSDATLFQTKAWPKCAYARILNSIRASQRNHSEITAGGRILWPKESAGAFPEFSFLNKPKFQKDNAAGIQLLKPLPKTEILAAPWPLSTKCEKGMKSLENAMGDVPQWLSSAIVIRGKPGRGQGSHMWNPVMLAVNLYLHGWICNEKKLQRLMDESFPDWLDEWEIKKELIFAA